MTAIKTLNRPEAGSGKKANGRRSFGIYKTLVHGCRVYVGENRICGHLSVPTWGYSPDHLAEKIVALRRQSGDGVNLEFFSRKELADDKEPLTTGEKDRFMMRFSEMKSTLTGRPLSSSRT